MAQGIYITRHVAIHQQKVFFDGKQVFESNKQDTGNIFLDIYQALEVKYPRFYKMDNLSKLGWLAAEWLLKEAPATGLPDEEVAVVLSNASSSLDADAKYFASVAQMASPALFVYTLPNIVIGEICIRHQLRGENAFFISETFDTGFIQFYVGNLLDENNVQACICGWVECLADDYKAVLFLVEKGDDTEATHEDKTSFSTENLHQLYELYNG